MKQLTALMMVSLLIFASCQKEIDVTNSKDISYAESDFVNNEIVSPNADKNGVRHSNLKVVIRKVNNAESTYRLVLKVDSVSADIDGDGLEEMLALGEDATVQAGLSVPNPLNPDDALVVFNSTSLTFRKQSENGYYVFVSDAFVSDLDFDYELVGVQYQINPRWTHVAVTHKVIGSGQFFILPNGKSIEQDPKIAKLKIQGPGRGGSGSSAVFNSIRITTFDDPTGQVASVVFKTIVIGINNTKEETVVPLEAILTPVGVGNALGVTIWANDDCVGYINPKNNQWECEDVWLRPYTNFGLLLDGANYLLAGDGSVIASFPLNDDLLSGRTDHF